MSRIWPLTEQCGISRFQYLNFKQVQRFFYFIFLKVIYFNWKLIILQFCGGICHILTWIRHGCTCVPHPEPPPPPSPSHPPGLSQSTGFECPVSCIELGLVIYFTYGNIHDLIHVFNSQIILLSPSPTWSESLFFISVSLLLYRI